MIAYEAIKSALEGCKDLWVGREGGMDGATVDDLRQSEKFHFLPNKKMARLGLAIMNKLSYAGNNVKSVQEYYKLYAEAAAIHKWPTEALKGRDIYFSGLFMAVVVSQEADIDQIIAEQYGAFYNE